jgi:hypothetical protein
MPKVDPKQHSIYGIRTGVSQVGSISCNLCLLWFVFADLCLGECTFACVTRSYVFVGQVGHGNGGSNVVQLQVGRERNANGVGAPKKASQKISKGSQDFIIEKAQKAVLHAIPDGSDEDDDDYVPPL